jgi:hypothetical protein
LTSAPPRNYFGVLGPLPSGRPLHSRRPRSVPPGGCRFSGFFFLTWPARRRISGSVFGLLGRISPQRVEVRWALSRLAGSRERGEKSGRGRKNWLGGLVPWRRWPRIRVPFPATAFFFTPPFRRRLAGVAPPWIGVSPRGSTARFVARGPPYRENLGLRTFFFSRGPRRGLPRKRALALETLGASRQGNAPPRSVPARAAPEREGGTTGIRLVARTVGNRGARLPAAWGGPRARGRGRAATRFRRFSRRGVPFEFPAP